MQDLIQDLKNAVSKCNDLLGVTAIEVWDGKIRVQIFDTRKFDAIEGEITFDQQADYCKASKTVNGVEFIKLIHVGSSKLGLTEMVELANRYLEGEYA